MGKPSSHLWHLERKIPDLLQRRILDLGSGNGRFMREVKERGGTVTGLEYNPKRAALSGSIVGQAEHCPFPDHSFDFINMSEVIEHVQDPVKVLSEVRRLLAPGGIAYISVPSRYSLWDPHYHVYFINWMPRRWADFIIHTWRGKKPKMSGNQSLGEMNYYTFRKFRRVCNHMGLDCVESRAVPSYLKGPYKFLKWLLPAFHFFVQRIEDKSRKLV